MAPPCRNAGLRRRQRGLVGSAIERRLRAGGFTTSSAATARTSTSRPRRDHGVLRARAARVRLRGGREGGRDQGQRPLPADFIRVNLQIQINVIDAAFRHQVKKLLFLGALHYPKHRPAADARGALLTGTARATNDAYALAKIAGIVTCK
jgi:GDP-L-fucose synthase